MEVYLVGGAVRDALMGLPVQDRDWVVVGATPEQLLAQGFTPVGRDFPVFLHPTTHEEYALARTERNTAGGYRGFAVHAAPDVTLEDDLARRDLTINSIAAYALSTRPDGQFDLKNGLTVAVCAGSDRLVDPFGGQADIAHKMLRHVTPAFREDPVRILRVARFAARFTDFTVAPETLALMRTMVDAGETDHLVPERVWQELARGLMEQQPSRMFAVLHACGALAHLLPALARGDNAPAFAGDIRVMPPDDVALRAIDHAAQCAAHLPVRVACLVRHTGAAFLHLRMPNDCRELAQLVAREHRSVDQCLAFDAEAVLDLLERCDALRKPARFSQALLACEIDAGARSDRQDTPYPQRQRLETALAAAQAVATNAIAAHAQSTGSSGQLIGQMIRQARLQAVAAALPAPLQR